jgi:hypothetical protein
MQLPALQSQFKLVSMKLLSVKSTELPNPAAVRHELTKPKFHGPCLRPRLLTILTFSFQIYYHKAKRVEPGNLLK